VTSVYCACIARVLRVVFVLRVVCVLHVVCVLRVLRVLCVFRILRVLSVPHLFRGAQGADCATYDAYMSCCGLCIWRVASMQRIAHPACSARIEVIDRTARSARRE
jgi:hypothetical protein